MGWLDFETTTAPNPKKGGEPLRIAFSNDIAGTYHKMNKRTPVFQAWCHVLGKLPPINNIGKIESGTPSPTLTTLHNSIACFGGIRRPHDDEADGKSVLVYVVRAEYSLEYAPDMACLARTFQVPDNTVFTVQVRPYHALQEKGESVDGLVTKIEPVYTAPDSNGLPAGFDSRYLDHFW